MKTRPVAQKSMKTEAYVWQVTNSRQSNQTLTPDSFCSVDTSLHQSSLTSTRLGTAACCLKCTPSRLVTCLCEIIMTYVPFTDPPLDHLAKQSDLFTRTLSINTYLFILSADLTWGTTHSPSLYSHGEGLFSSHPFEHATSRLRRPISLAPQHYTSLKTSCMLAEQADVGRILPVYKTCRCATFLQHSFSHDLVITIELTRTFVEV
ncbi:hypothetical protein EDD18DRAFT_664753 [Armillaria luteobubalina]|uniref:Uncharacterized protein n=1 Tax=Armillaria luteobubalina TaxID=153913 RepID=A0AA39PLY7_9AGAR|nr:hypothetical protein EDD18DRAFT_664753 [Armillaria luteobubalina]